MSKDKSKVWVKLIEEYERSGVSPSQFCIERRVSRSNFYSWKARLKKKGLLPKRQDPADQNTASKEKTSRFMEALVPSLSELNFEPKRLTLKVNEQFSLELEKEFDEALLLRALRVLGQL